MSLFPYLAFLYFLTKSGKTPRLTLIGFYFLLAFVGATIPAGIYGRSFWILWHSCCCPLEEESGMARVRAEQVPLL